MLDVLLCISTMCLKEQVSEGEYCYSEGEKDQRVENGV